VASEPTATTPERIQQTAAAILTDLEGVVDVVRQDFAGHLSPDDLTAILSGEKPTREKFVALETMADLTRTMQVIRTGYGLMELRKLNISAAAIQYQAALRAASQAQVFQGIIDLQDNGKRYDDAFARKWHCDEGFLALIQVILASQHMDGLHSGATTVDHVAAPTSGGIGETVALTAHADKVLDNGFTLFGYQQQLLSTTLPPIHCPSPDRVPATIDPQELFEKYINRNLPFIVEAGTFAAWPANSKWTRAGLVEHYAGLKVNVAPKPLPSMPSMPGDSEFDEYEGDPAVKQMHLEAFLDTAMDNVDGDGNATHPELRYVFNTVNVFGTDVEHSFALFPRWEQIENQPPPFFDNTPHFDEFVEFSVGPALSGAHMHSHMSTWNAVVSGKKRWVISPLDLDNPASKRSHLEKGMQQEEENAGEDSGSDVHHNPNYDWDQAYRWFKDELPKLQQGSLCRLLEFEQGPGELVFIPDQYYHAVLNLEPTVAAAKQLGRATWPDALPEFIFD
jgi:hypothetical protein